MGRVEWSPAEPVQVKSSEGKRSGLQESPLQGHGGSISEIHLGETKAERTGKGQTLGQRAGRSGVCLRASQ